MSPRALLPLLLGFLVAASPARGFVAQTITVDGVNDFDPSNLVRDDRLDTQRFYCVPDSVHPLDLGRLFVTNDNSFIYFGYEYARHCFTEINLGLAIDVDTPEGGTTDPFGRKIGWAGVPQRPEFVVYDVPSYPGNTYHFQVLYKWTGTEWADSTRLVNGVGSGPNALGIVDHTGFVEFKLPLAVLGTAPESHLHLEWWVTQEGALKGPLDAALSSDVQLSRASGTTWDTTAVVQMTRMYDWTVLKLEDFTPPTVRSVVPTTFAVLPDGQFALGTDRLDLTFSEPVQSGQAAASYAYSGPLVRTVTEAQRDPTAADLVHLTLDAPISANAGFHTITVTGVKDLAGNTIVPDGLGNVRSCFIQNVEFRGDFHPGLCHGSFAPTDDFALEGSLAPLTFSPLCDNGMLRDANGDSVYTITVPFGLSKDPVTHRAEADLEWKFSHACVEYEPLADNRPLHLSSDLGPSLVVGAWWGHDAPQYFSSHPVDVVFQVDASRVHPTPGDVFELRGSEPPLAFAPPGVPLRDDGAPPDAVAGDGIYTARVRFPRCAFQSIGWKVFYRGGYECLDQADRSFWLNDAVWDTVGSVAGPLVLPARGIERCTVTDKPVTVVFRVDMTLAHPQPADTVAVMGSVPPLVFAPEPLDPAARLLDDGSGYDAVAGDRVFTRAITFPDSSERYVEFKYWMNGTYECSGLGNRWFVLDDVIHSATVPWWRPPNGWDYCSDPTAVPVAPRTPDATASFAVLRQSFPNPMSPRTTIRFDLKRAGRVSLAVYDVSGRRVATLLERALPAGPQDVTWDGRDADGQRVRSGIYLYELAMGKERLSRRLVIAR